MLEGIKYPDTVPEKKDFDITRMSLTYFAMQVREHLKNKEM